MAELAKKSRFFMPPFQNTVPSVVEGMLRRMRRICMPSESSILCPVGANVSRNLSFLSLIWMAALSSESR